MTLISLLGFVGIFSLNRTSAILLLIQTAVVICGLTQLRKIRWRRTVLALVVATCLGSLAVARLLAYRNTIELPFGISYFSLTLLGLFLDFYRSRATPPLETRKLISFCFFLPFLPLGPIERWDHLSPQIEKSKIWSNKKALEGLQLISMGLFKKLVVADRLDKPFEEYRRIALSTVGYEMWLFSLLALIHIFCDFSSLIDITRGISKLLGIDLIDNFNQPYFAQSIPDVWKRWHISLVNWLRDFVYTPIALQTNNLYLAAFATMLTVGFWHAVSWNYTAWAVYWSALYGISIYLRKQRRQIAVYWWIKSWSLVAAMSVSGLILVPTTGEQATTLFRNFFAFPTGANSLFQKFEISQMNLLIVCIGFLLIVMAESFNRRTFRSNDSELSLRSCLFISISTLGFATLTIALAVEQAKKFLYLNY